MNYGQIEKQKTNSPDICLHALENFPATEFGSLFFLPTHDSVPANIQKEVDVDILRTKRLR
ncbi:hypothetical protein TUM15745_04650 [Neisseria gonorrhoeae]|nr:hypothetical protein TUM15745_04650 [Neisseria gonorrhoeae]GFL00488.1 hypothetical protein TUM15746_02710 [Neisseria gonorrhoeae]GFL12752.1 hypothetical protein TUM15752_01630 [Neisseria gonorrhoeae]GFL27056.1 hypothetical protein TUM15759_02750 [Neisseria gonorrhoeae]GFL37399.1 hypothetical protein TUM15764_04030 [Neisseria gonorrhoeae]